LKRPYTIINVVIAGVTGMIFLYSGIFSSSEDNHPVPCVHKQITGEDCKTCGFSNAFSEMVRGNLREARSFNPIAPSVFIFFLVQLFMRGFFLIASHKYPEQIKFLAFTDAFLSVILFLYSFRELLIFW
jgi:hypothetical protein